MRSSMAANDTGTMSVSKDNNAVVSILDDENLKQQSYLIPNSDDHGKCPPIDIEFVDLTYTVPISKHDSKVLLRSISGLFKSNQLTAIMGSSGAGKSTLLNVLAGYKTGNSNGNILINGYPRNLEKFRKLSRYIMQEDLLQPKMTVFENMKIACHLKLGTTVSGREKYRKIFEIMDLLRLRKTRDTMTNCLSGGEKKRLSIALELINDPPVIFLDEPTTGLDDVASAQCITLLKTIAMGGRTVICSIHTPSARIFSTFDHVYIMADGQCAYAGLGEDVVTFLSTLSLNCPTHYNPADFVIEVLNREYGDHTERMIMAVDNGRIYRWNKPIPCYRSNNDIKSQENFKYALENQEEFSKHLYNFNSSGWLQFNILLYRMFIQSWHDKAFILLKVVTYLMIGVVIGSLYFQFGNDASKTIFNFGFFFCTNIVLMYVPLLPVLLSFPMEVQLLKREYFNRWYGLNAYFCALTFFRTFLQVILSMFYVLITYFMTDQPLEFMRMVKFCVICIYVAIVSESFGYVISSQLNVVNSIFVGPALSVPFMLLAVYGMGTGSSHIPILIRIAMYFSYLRYGLEGMVMAVYGDGREGMECPPDVTFCEIRYPDELLKLVGMENVSYWFDIVALTVILIFLKISCYFLLRMRLSTTPSIFALTFIGRFVKTHFTVNR